MTEISELSARELSAQMESGALSAVEVMRATLDRISAVNGAVNAVVALRDEDVLMAEAAAADSAPRKGWLHGIPMAVKDLCQTAGIPSTMGFAPYADRVPSKDDMLPQRLKADGAILIGKTNTPEFGLGSHTFNPVYGATKNPYDLGRSAGGSSGGAAAALATRMVSVADGSDMMGSLRNPAGWNNVYGMRPTYGVVPSDPVGDVFLHPLSTLGPMARDPMDLASLLGTLAGPDPRQPWGQAFDASALMAEQDIKGKRIGWLADWGGAYPMEDGILALCESGLRVFEDLGAHVEAIPAPHSSEAIWDAWVTLRAWANAASSQHEWDDPTLRAHLKPAAVWEIETGRAFRAIELHNASVAASAWYRRAAELFAQYDALVLPSAQVWPFPIEWDWPKEINGQAMDTYHRWMEVVLPVSLIGLPCVNLPAGFGDQGLPGGMQLFGPRGADLALLQMAQAYHAATGWPDRRPPSL